MRKPLTVLSVVLACGLLVGVASDRAGVLLAESPAIGGAAPIEYEEITVPAGTLVPITLDSHVASDTSYLEDPVRAHVRSDVVVRGVTVIPAGAPLYGHVSTAKRSGRVKGVARVGFRIDSIDLGDFGRTDVSATSVTRYAPATKRRDAATIGFPAAGGAVIGALAGGKKGALIGAAAGGGAGTAVVLTTRGKEIRLGPGYRAAIRLLEPIVVQVPVESTRFRS